jgi:DNA-binding SARP family transcriptional activator
VLEIKVLGDLQVLRDGTAMALPPSRKTRALLAYLALTRCPHRREQLCDMFWDVPDDPRGSLRWSLSKIRPLVDDPALPRLLADRQSVELRSEGADVGGMPQQIRGAARREFAARSVARGLPLCV